MKKIIFAIMALMVLGLVASVSAITPAAITGTIYDQDANPVDGASVVATCNDVPADAVLSDTDGTYYVIFDSEDCGYNSPVSVTATKDDATGTNTGFTCESVEDCDIPVALVDVTIPELTVIGGAIVLLAGLGIIAYRRK
jgi:hypothetical protein